MNGKRLSLSSGRRTFLGQGLIAAGTLVVPVSAASAFQSAAPIPHADFPQQDPKLVRETVAVSHGNFARVRELVEASPALAKANVDWGYGDWESALGAASHTGNRDIAEFLIENGARPTLFSAVMLGQLKAVQALIEASPGIQRIPGPHSITLLSHAKAGGDSAVEVLRYLEALGDADFRERMDLPDQEKDKFLGVYEFGNGAEDRIEVYDRRGSLMVKRVEGLGRGMIYRGENSFNPAGASAVRLRFEIENGVARSVSVFDPDLIVKAVRVQ